MAIKTDKNGILTPRNGLYIVERTSGDEPPCDDATKVRATCSDRGALKWSFVWMIEIDDIMSFVDKYNDCIVSRNKDGFAEIEIYDDYH